MRDVKRPALEGSVAVRDDRRLSFAEYGTPRGEALVWMHGTPGARRQIPLEARALAEQHGLRIIGVDRPGIGSSTPHLYPDILDWTADLELLLDALAVDTVRMIGLSGGGPVRAGRRRGAAGPGARRRGARRRGAHLRAGRGPAAASSSSPCRLAPLLRTARVPLGVALTAAIRLVKPLAGPGLDLYAMVQPPGDKNLLSRPEFKAMFLDDLLNGSRFQTSAPLNDLVLFTRDWGFRPADVAVPVRWWHGDEDHIVPHRARAARRRSAARRHADRRSTGRATSGGLGIAEEVIDTLMSLGPRRTTGESRPRASH